MAEAIHTYRAQPATPIAPGTTAWYQAYAALPPQAQQQVAAYLAGGGPAGKVAPPSPTQVAQVSTALARKAAEPKPIPVKIAGQTVTVHPGIMEIPEEAGGLKGYKLTEPKAIKPLLPSVQQIMGQIGERVFKPPELKPKDLVKLPDGYMLRADFNQLTSQQQAAARGGGLTALQELQTRDLEATYKRVLKEGSEGSWQVANRELSPELSPEQKGKAEPMFQAFKKLPTSKQAELITEMAEKAGPGVIHAPDVLGGIFKGRVPTSREMAEFVTPGLYVFRHRGELSPTMLAVNILLDAAFVGTLAARPATSAIRGVLGKVQAQTLSQEASAISRAIKSGDVTRIQKAGASLTKLGEDMRAAGVAGADAVIQRGRLIQRQAPQLAKGEIPIPKLTESALKQRAKLLLAEERGEITIRKPLGRTPQVITTKTVDLPPGVSISQARGTGLTERQLMDAARKGKTQVEFWREVKRIQADNARVNKIMEDIAKKQAKPTPTLPTPSQLARLREMGQRTISPFRRKGATIDLDKYLSKAERDRILKRGLRQAEKLEVSPAMRGNLLTWNVAAAASRVIQAISKLSPENQAKILAQVDPKLREAIQAKQATKAAQLAEAAITAAVDQAAAQAVAQAKAEGATETQAEQRAKEAAATEAAPAALVSPAMRVVPVSRVTPAKGRVPIPTVTVPRVRVPEGKKPRPLKLRIPLPIIPPEKKLAELTAAQRRGIIGWRQGFIYKAIYPPYGAQDVINSRERIPGIRYVTGPKSAFASIARITKGRIPPHLARDMGIMDIRISIPERGRPRIKFAADPKQKTRLTPAGAGRMM